MNISTCMAVVSQLDMTKEAYHHFRRVYPAEELCIAVNHDEATYKWVKELAFWDMNLKYVWTEELISFSANYNKAVSLATKDKIVFYHNDMIPAPGFLERLDMNEDPMYVLGYTTVEPPVFKDHERPGKIIQDFGGNFEEFQLHNFEQYANRIVYNPSPTASDTPYGPEHLADGTFFFMSLYKKTFDAIGGFDDKTFVPVFCEDDDLIMRLIHYGCKIQTTNLALVYHLVSRTIRFSDTPQTLWHASSQSVEIQSIRNFIRKWGKKYNGYENKKANVIDIGYRITNTTPQFLLLLEPYAKNLQVDIDPTTYIEEEQSKTVFDLQSKFTDTLTNAVVVDINTMDLVPHTFNILTELSRVLTSTTAVGKFKYGPFTVTVQKPINNLADTLIRV